MNDEHGLMWSMCHSPMLSHDIPSRNCDSRCLTRSATVYPTSFSQLRPAFLPLRACHICELILPRRRFLASSSGDLSLIWLAFLHGREQNLDVPILCRFIMNGALQNSQTAGTLSLLAAPTHRLEQ